MDHHHHSSLELFSSSLTETQCPLNTNSPYPPPQPPATPFYFLSLWIWLAILGTPYKWNHSVFVLLCLAYVTQHNVLKAHTHCRRNQNFPPTFRGPSSCLLFVRTTWFLLSFHKRKETGNSPSCSVHLQSTPSITGPLLFTFQSSSELSFILCPKIFSAISKSNGFHHSTIESFPPHFHFSFLTFHLISRIIIWIW